MASRQERQERERNGGGGGGWNIYSAQSMARPCSSYGHSSRALKKNRN